MLSEKPKNPWKIRANKAKRQQEAKARQAQHDGLTLAQKLANPALGAKERAKLVAKQKATVK